MSNCKHETSNGRCGLKGSYAYRHKCYTEDMCRCHEPKTNADHIRSMTDEELTNTIHAFSLGWRGQTNWCDFHCENPGEDGCDKCISLWLKQPYREDT
jgi:hypothetical protein